MSAETKTMERRSILTPKLWVMLAAFSLLMSLAGVLTAPFGPTWMWSILFGTFTAPIVILFILLLISRVVKLPLTPQHLALVYTAAAMSVAFCYSMIPYGIIHNAA
ncbi:MAG: hypothetical protein LM580_09380, partial [Thermofilum sp.]|nr:hypothetical protein [Thermofilum sp.]